MCIHLRVPLFTLVAAALAATASNAAVVGLSPMVNLAGGPFHVVLDADTSYIFFDSGLNGGPFGFPLAAIQTTGGATVASLGPPFFAQFKPSYFTDPDRAVFIDQNLLARFLPYAAPATIDDNFDAFLALKFTLADGDHFGFARVAGLFLSDFAYETTPGLGITVNEGPFAPPSASACAATCQ